MNEQAAELAAKEVIDEALAAVAMVNSGAFTPHESVG